MKALLLPTLLILAACTTGPVVRDTTFMPYSIMVCTDRPNLAELEHFVIDHGCKNARTDMTDPYVVGEPTNCAMFRCEPSDSASMDDVFIRRPDEDPKPNRDREPPVHDRTK
jgi:hypothetical protein